MSIRYVYYPSYAAQANTCAVLSAELEAKGCSQWTRDSRGRKDIYRSDLHLLEISRPVSFMIDEGSLTHSMHSGVRSNEASGKALISWINVHLRY